MLAAAVAGQPVDPAARAAEEQRATMEIVKFQIGCQLTAVSDGEQAATSFLEPPGLSGYSGDSPRFWPAGWRAAGWPAADGADMGMHSNNGPITLADPGRIATRIANMNAACEQVPGARENAFLTVPSPGTLVMCLGTSYYPSRLEFLGANAAALNQVIKMITSAGFEVQIDAPDLAMLSSFEMLDATVAEIRHYTAMHVQSINAALDGIDPHMVAVHVCWGNYPDPSEHEYDAPLEGFLDLVFNIPARTLVIPGTLPRHHNDIKVFGDYPLPDGWNLGLGVIDVLSKQIEDPDVIAAQLVQAARIVGEDQLRWAATNCGWSTMGLSPWTIPLDVIAHKTAAQVEGARRANACLFGTG